MLLPVDRLGLFYVAIFIGNVTISVYLYAF